MRDTVVVEFPVAAQPALSGILLRTSVAMTLVWILGTLLVVGRFAATTQSAAGSGGETLISAIVVAFIYAGAPVMLLVGVLALLVGGISLVPVLVVRRWLTERMQSALWVTTFAGAGIVFSIVASTQSSPGSALVVEGTAIGSVVFAVAGVVALLVTPNLTGATGGR